MNSRTTIRVALGDRAYDVIIGAGLLTQAGHLIAALRPGAKVAVVADSAVATLHFPTLESSFKAASVPHEKILVEPGEPSKNFKTLANVCDRILTARLGRDDLVVAFGGGVIGDLAGFAAAIVRRGLSFVQIPTTLLAQVDSSVGGKTGINSQHGKNLIGSFHQPILVIADTTVLNTLPAREFRAGYAEIAKYGLINNCAFFDWLEKNWQGILTNGPERELAIAMSCNAKAAIVARDETETGERALLNLGHTFGHALEVLNGYDAKRLIHGEGVSIGMTLAYELSARLHLCSYDDALRVASHLSAVGLPTRISDIPHNKISTEAFMVAMAQDKKVKQGRLTFVLTRGIGQAFVENNMDPDAVRLFLDEKLSVA